MARQVLMISWTHATVTVAAVIWWAWHNTVNAFLFKHSSFSALHWPLCGLTCVHLCCRQHGVFETQLPQETSCNNFSLATSWLATIWRDWQPDGSCGKTRPKCWVQPFLHDVCRMLSSFTWPNQTAEVWRWAASWVYSSERVPCSNFVISIVLRTEVGT